MKRFISLLTVFLMLITCCVFSTGTVFASEGDFTYKAVDGGVEITSFTGDLTEKDELGNIIDKTLYIPETLGGSKVVAIGDKAFYQNKSKVFVVIPEGVKSIGNRAFAGAYIRGIEMPDTVEAIGDSAFNICVYIEKVTLSSSLKTIPNSCFCQCTRLEELVIPEGVEVIEDSAFQTNNHLTSLTLPSTLRTIGEYAFAYSSLSVILIPEGVTELADFSFFMSPNLETLEIAGTVKTIGENAFRSCELLSTLTLHEGIETIGANAFESCALTSVSIPASVTEIGDNAIGYAWNDELWDCYLISDFEIICVEGSAGHEYAQSNGITNTATPAEPPTSAPTEPPTSAPTEPPTSAPTEPPTSAPTEPPTSAPTTPPTSEPTTPPTSEPTEPPTGVPVKNILLGDADLDEKITIKDATAIQKVTAMLITLNADATKAADVDANNEVNIRDASAIQKFVAALVVEFPIGQLIK